MGTVLEMIFVIRPQVSILTAQFQSEFGLQTTWDA